MSSPRKDARAYAQFHHDLDAGRRVLQCHGCEAREPWSDAALAVARGWAYEDKVVSSRRIRFWHCSNCRRPEELQPMPPRQVQSTRDKSGEAFGGRRVVIVRFGASMTQIAVVLEQREESADVVAWAAGPQTFRQPKTVPMERIVATAGPNDKRVRAARAQWPEFYARELEPKQKKQGKRRKATSNPPLRQVTSLALVPCEPGSLLDASRRFL